MRLFNMKHTLESAQPLTFFGEIRDSGYSVTYPYKEALVNVEQLGQKIHYTYLGDSSKGEIDREVRRRFGLDDNLSMIYKAIGTDDAVERAVRAYSGMRVTQNDPWETLLCFIISQFNNVKRIRGIVLKIIERFGEEHSVYSGGKVARFKSFPDATALAKASLGDLARCGTGFRAKYIKSAAELCAYSFDLDRPYCFSYEKAKTELMELPGVGDKVADCVLLMGYKKLEAFPIDTWVKRAMERIYFKGRKKTIRYIHEFAAEKWGTYAGYAQQYLFHYARTKRMVA